MSQDIAKDDFDISYNTVVGIRSKADLVELWEGLRRELNTTIRRAYFILLIIYWQLYGTFTVVYISRSLWSDWRMRKQWIPGLLRVREGLGTRQRRKMRNQRKRIYPNGVPYMGRDECWRYQPSLDEAPSNSMFLRACGAATKRRTTADIVS